MPPFFSQRIKARVSSRIGHVIILLANAIFFVVWVFVQYFLYYYVVIPFKLEDMLNVSILNFLRLFFGITTLIPILIDFYYDVKIMLKQSEKSLKDDLN